MLLHENENVTKERVAIGQTKKSIDRKRNTDFLVQCPLIFKIFCDFLIKYFSNAKGQLISEGNFGIFKSPQSKPFFEGFLPYS